MSAAADASGVVVVIAVDGSGESSRALQFYVNHFHKPGNSVVMVHALDMPNLPTRESWDSNVEKGNKKRTELQESCAKMLSDAGVKGTFVSDLEKPGPFICATAQKEKAAYVVVGTRGLGKLKRTVLGSVSDYVLHNCECPVFTYREK